MLYNIFNIVSLYVAMFVYLCSGAVDPNIFDGLITAFYNV